MPYAVFATDEHQTKVFSRLFSMLVSMLVSMLFMQASVSQATTAAHLLYCGHSRQKHNRQHSET